MAKKKIQLKFIKSAIPVGYAYGKDDVAAFDAKTAKSLMQDGFAIPFDAEDEEAEKETVNLEDVEYSSDVSAEDAKKLIKLIEDFQTLKAFTHGETRKTVQEAAKARAEELTK